MLNIGNAILGLLLVQKFRGQGNSPCGYKVSGNARSLREGISGEIRFCGRESRLKCLIVNVLWVFIQHTGYLFDTVYYSYRHRSESCGMNEILFFLLEICDFG